jgi:hypothetical protein
MDSGSPFLITGLGASGTRWLARYLDGCRGWRVWHENGPRICDLARNQGVVSSMERYMVMQQHFSYLRIGVIVRNPVSIAEHCLNKGTYDRVMDEMDRDLVQLDKILEMGAKALRFVDLTTRPENVCKWLGLPVPPSIPEIVGRQERIKTLTDQQRTQITNETRWFADKWLQPRT